MSSSPIVYSALLDLPICTSEKCLHGMDFSGIKSHLRRRHPFSDQESIETLISQERENSKADLGANHPNPLREKYLATIRGEQEEYISGPALPPIPLLPVVDAFKCPGCRYIAQKHDTIRKHISQPACCSHANSPMPQLKAQTILSGNRQRYFEVIQEDDPEVTSCILTKTLASLQGSSPEEAVPQGVDVSKMDSLLSTFRFDTQLANNKLSLQQARDLTIMTDTEKRSSIRKVVASYHKFAFNLTEQKVYIKSHTFMGTNLSLAIAAKTVTEYDSRFCRLIHFILNCCTGDNPLLRNHFSPDFISKVKELDEMLAREAPMQDTHKILHFLLYRMLFTPIRDDRECVTIFISCCSVVSGVGDQSFRFANGSDLSPMLAAIKHFARCIVVMEVYAFHKDDKEQAWDRIDRAVHANADNGLHFTQYCMAACNRLRIAETHKCRFTLCPKHPLCAIIDGIELSLDNLGTKMREIQARACSLLNNDILNGLEISDDFWKSASEMQDSLTDLTPAYWFGTHRANKHLLDYWSKSLLQRYKPLLLQSGTLCKKEASEFLARCEELQSLLYVLLQTCSGAPARASELGILRVCNTSIGPRNIFFNGGHLFTVIAYHKGRNVQEGLGRPVARYPDGVTAGILLVYLMVVRPLESTVVQLLHGCHSNEEQEAVIYQQQPSTSTYGSKHRDYLFSSRGNPHSTERLRLCFEKHMTTHGIPLGTSQYRQYHSGVIKNFLGAPDYDDGGRPAGTTSSTTVLHNQAGHSELTAHQVYGVSSVDMRKLTGTELDAFRVASKTWHLALGMVHSGPCPAPDQVSQSQPHSFTEDKPLLGTDAGEILRRLDRMENAMTNFFRTMKDRTRTAADAGLPLDSEESPRKRSRPEHPECSIPDTKRHMRTFLNNECADFRSKEQEQAVLHSIKAKRDALIVLPTGGGKSLAFMLPAFLKEDKCVVVIVPLVALQNDLVARCQQAGLQTSTWRARDVAGSRLIIASAEHVGSTQYQAFIRELSVKNKLHAIFIDEAHLVLLWQKFRDCMRSLHNYVRPTPVQVPIIALTATAPPTIETSIAAACGMSEWVTIRRNTSRSNILYKVRDVSSEDMFRKVDGALCAYYTQYNTTNCRAIVYVQTREDCETLSVTLTALSPKVPCFKYHAGMNPDEKDLMQRGWKDNSDGKAHVMVATTAFGCGIDVPTVRIVIHAGQPKTLTEFIQESGRAGRDGKPASSLVFNSSASRHKDSLPQDRVPFSDPDTSSEPLEQAWSESMFGTTEGLSETSTECRRWILDRFVDGAQVSLLKTCQERGMQLCDICAAGNVSRGNSPTLQRAFTQPLYLPTEDKSTPPSTESGSSMGTKSCSTTATAKEIREDYGSRITTHFCPVCTTRERTIVEHTTEEESAWTCFRNSCLRCSLPGHGFSKCTMFKRPESDKACRSCGIRKLDDERIHRDGEYGKKFCRIKKILCLALRSWSDPTLKTKMIADIPEVASFKTISDLADWLLGHPSPPFNITRTAGIKSFTPWFFTKILRLSA